MVDARADDSNPSDDSALEAQDSGDPPLPAGRCPAEMAPIRDADGAVRVCVDRWEAVVEGILGERDQYAEGAVITAAITRSLAGGLPNTGVTFGQARQACANTPVLDEAGAEVGRKRLVRASEWEDAGDGVWGEGGLAYPWGDDWTDGVCNVPGTDGQATQAGELPAGSLPDCVSAFGVYDLVGNLWEWTDPGWDADVAAFLAAAAERGAALGEDDAVSWGEDLSDLVMDVAGVSRASLERGEDGILRAWADPSTRPYTDRSALGFLVFSGDDVVGRENSCRSWSCPRGIPSCQGRRAWSWPGSWTRGR